MSDDLPSPDQAALERRTYEQTLVRMRATGQLSAGAYEQLIRADKSAFFRARTGHERKSHRERRLAQRLAQLEASQDPFPPPAPALPESRPTRRFVYVIGADRHPLKIGVASDPERRLNGIQTGCPTRLEILFTVEVDDPITVERAAHRELSAKRLTGEWFDVHPSDAIAVVRRLAAAA